MIDVDAVPQIKRLLLPQCDGISACIVGKQWIYAFGGILFETSQNRMSQIESGSGYQYSLNTQHANTIQRINLKHWGEIDCNWQFVQVSKKRGLPRISKCAAVHLPDSDKVILFGGDYQMDENNYNIGFEYIYVDLKLGYEKSQQEKLIEKKEIQNGKEIKQKKVECKYGKEKFRLMSALSVGYMSGPKAYAMFQGNSIASDETILKVIQKYGWKNQSKKERRIKIEEEIYN